MMAPDKDMNRALFLVCSAAFPMIRRYRVGPATISTVGLLQLDAGAL